MQDPTEVLDEYGADALRLYLINSPVVRGETLRFKKDGVFAVVKDVFLPWYNAYRFLVQNVLRLQQQTGITFEPTKVLIPVYIVLQLSCYSAVTACDGQAYVCHAHSHLSSFHVINYRSLAAVCSICSVLLNWTLSHSSTSHVQSSQKAVAWSCICQAQPWCSSQSAHAVLW